MKKELMNSEFAIDKLSRLTDKQKHLTVTSPTNSMDK